MFLLYVFIILFILLFIPIPLKFNILYSKSDFEIKLYNIMIYSKNKGLVNKYLKKKNAKTNNKSNNSNIDKATSNNKKVNSSKNKTTSKPDIKDIKDLAITLNKNKFKPKIKLDYTLQYSLSDAAYTALFYGFIWNINIIIFNALSLIFKVKYYIPRIEPKFINKFSVNFSFSCIIFFNIAKLIYMLFKILSCKKNWEVIPV